MTPVQRCSICGGTYAGFGNDPAPIVNDPGARCCDVCNQTVVIPARERDKRLGNGRERRQ
jgi:hypothetical protein